MKRVLVINGPNLNLLGDREPAIYGATTLNELEALVTGWGSQLGITVSCFQSNHEGAIIDRLHDGRHAQDGIVINAGALTHYSYALHDAIAAVDLPTVEVHISNIKEREDWRRASVISAACDYMIRGRGIDGYRYALEYLVNQAAARPEVLHYGAAEDQVGALLVPDGPGPHPVAVLIHGGFWRDRWTRDTMDGLAGELRVRGWATWNMEYHRVGTGGGWPATFEDVAAGLEHLATLAQDYDLNTGKVVLVGHSAGGHLALWAAVRPHLSDRIPDPRVRVRPRAVVALAPVADLEEAYTRNLGDGAVAELLRRAPRDGADRYGSGSPQHLLPLGVRQVLMHGTEDAAVPIEMSRAYVTAARKAGDTVDYRELDGVDHMSLINPKTPAGSSVISVLDELAGVIGARDSLSPGELLDPS